MRKYLIAKINSSRLHLTAPKLTTEGISGGDTTRDLTTADGVETVIKATEQAIGSIDILVNNAGGSNSATAPGWFETPEEMGSRATARMHAGSAAGSSFRPVDATARMGRLIQFSSRNAISPYAQFGPYGAAKAALNNLTLSLSKALAGTGVTSNGIMPGAYLHAPRRPMVQGTGKAVG